MGKRVVIGLSGGVDSSVAAHLLVEEGYDVIGLFMKNWHDESVTISNECPWLEDSTDAMLVAQSLGIPFKTIDLSSEYKQKVVDYMFSEYEKGRTPNPDVLCNREIKFDVFLDAAMNLGADFVATGHYCQKRQHEDGRFQLIAGADNNKDQSYFLCQLNQSQLAKALFPIGHLEKPEVRKIAEKLDLTTAKKKDSQGICFVGKVSLPTFLQQKLLPKKGQVIEIPKAWAGFQVTPTNLVQQSTPFNFTEADGIVKGEHSGAHFFTVGQRKGLGIGGTIEPLFIIGTDVVNNLVFVGEGDQHPGLYRQALEIETPIHWVRSLDEQIGTTGLDVMARIRYRQKLEPATLLRVGEQVFLAFSKKQRGIAAGQFAAWYIEDELVGSGVINA
ncbi:MAG: tRNA-specific 2-thiouridylase [Sphingobacteriales bacterium]|jgi:tRNA-specific 2-thiouridylase